jgi:hypothetical protein
MADNGTGTSSVGLMGLSHFKTSRTSMEMYEPVYLNLFTVEIVLPTKLTEGGTAGAAGIPDADKLLFLEGIRKVNGLDTNKIPGVVQQEYKFSKRSFANSGPDDQSLEVSFDLEVNLRGSSAGQPDMYAVKLLRAWTDLVYDPLTGRQGLKVDYVAPSVTITLHDKANNPFWQWTLYNVFPSSAFNMPELDYGQRNNIYKISGFKLKCDYWDETML